MSNKVQFGDITVHCNSYGDGEHGFFYAKSENRDELEIVASLTEQLPEVKTAIVEYVPVTMSTDNKRKMGGYYKMIAEF